MAFIGTPLDTRNTFQSLAGKRFNGDGSETDFTLDVAPSSTLDIEVFVGNVRQDPNSAYTLSGTTLTFTGAPPSGTNNIYVVHQAKSVGTIDPPATETIAKTFSGALTANGGVIFNEDSADVDFRVESNGNANMLFVSGGNNVVGIGGEGDLGVGLHIRSADSGAAANGDADELVIEGSGASGMTIASGASSEGTISFADSGANNSGRIIYDHNANHMIFTAETTEGLRINGSAKLSTGGETAADVDSGGITLDQNANDAFSLTFKSSDVAHFTTNVAENDTYMSMSKFSAAQGGGKIVGYGEGGEALSIQGIIGGGQSSTAKSTSAGAPVIIKGTIEASNTEAILPSNTNAAVIVNHTTTRFIFDGDGDFHADSSSTTFDAYDDAQLVRAFDLSHGKGVIDSKFDKFVSYNHEKLADLQLVGREEDGTPNHFVNVTGMQRLHNGAIWQQYEKHNQLLEAVYELAEKAIGKKEAKAILDKHEVKRLN